MIGTWKSRPAEAGRVGYRPELDGLRAVAILAVMAYHYGLPFSQQGFLGVDVFFVLSGYLITSILASEMERTGRVDWRRFYLRRAARLLPAFWLMLVLVGPTVPIGSLVAAATYSIDLTMAFHWLPVERSLGHIWSLAVEWQFYLIWPLGLAFALRRWSRTRVAAASLAMAAASGVWAVIVGSSDWFRVWTAPDTQAWGLLVGSALALIGAQMPRARRLAMLAPIGRISYGLYLWHVPIWILLADQGLPIPALAIALTFAVAGLSWRYVEAPILRLARSPQITETIVLAHAPELWANTCAASSPPALTQ